MRKIDKIAKFLEGIASIISIYPQENRHKITLPTSPTCASLKNDWEKIGLDMWRAYKTIELQQSEAKNHRKNNDRFKKYSKQQL